jgi:hypothetical protein
LVDDRALLIEKFTLIGLRLQFEIDRRPKRACDGWFDYVMISVQTGRPA